MFAVFITVLCLLPVSYSVPLVCEKLVQPKDQFDHRGRWAVVAGSCEDPAAADALKGKLSITLYFHNSSYTQVNRFGDNCEYHHHNFSHEGHIFKIMLKTFNLTGTFLHTSCEDCAVLMLDIESLDSKSKDLYLFSKRRILEQKEMEEFRAQVECLNIPPPVVMDPTRELCAEQTESDAAAHTKEKTEGEKA